MPGQKGKTGRHTNRSNQWLKGTSERQRTDEVFAFKPKLAVIEAIKQDIQEREVTKTEWLDLAVESILGLDEKTASVGRDEASEPVAQLGVNHPLVREAIADFLENKRIAIARERKLKKPDQKLILQWLSEIEELEAILA